MGNNDICIACVGDIMPGGVLHGKDNQFIDSDVLSYLLSADIRIATLETAIGEGLEFDPEKMSRKKDIVYAPDSDLERLKILNIDVVSIANNHIFDLGYKGLKNTIQLLDSLGIKHCGAGDNLEEASKPVVINVKGKSVAFIAFCDYRDETVGYVPFAAASKPGINPLYDNYVISEIQKYKQMYDYVFVIPHWGIEHSHLPSPEVWSLSRKIIFAGADGIIGSHTHRIQPIIESNNKFVIYSLGNFMFFDRYINAPRPTYYPSSEENIDNYPVTQEYPYVTEPTLKLWPFPARVGMIVQILLGHNLKYEYKATFLTKDNYIRFYSLQEFDKMRKKLNLIGTVLKTPIYPIFYKSCRLMFSFLNFLSRKS